MAGSQRVVAHSAIAIVMGGSIAGLWPAAAAAEPYCAHSYGQTRRVYEVSRYCAPPSGSVRESLIPEILGMLGRAHRYREHYRRRPGDYPSLGWRKRYPPPAHETRHPHAPRSHPAEPVRPSHGRGRLDDRPGVIAGRPPIGHTGPAPEQAPGRVPPRHRAGPPANGAPPAHKHTSRPPHADTSRAPHAAKPPTGTHGTPARPDRATALGHPSASGRHTNPPRRTTSTGPGTAPHPGTSSRPLAPGRTPGDHDLGHARRGPHGARAVTPGRHPGGVAAKRGPRVSQRAAEPDSADIGTRPADPSIGARHGDSSIDARPAAPPKHRPWTIRRVGSDDDGLPALRFGVTLALGLVIAAGTLLLMRITRVIPLTPGDEDRGRWRPAGVRRGRGRGGRHGVGWLSGLMRAVQAGGDDPIGARRPGEPHRANARDAQIADARPRGGRPVAFVRGLLGGRRPSASRPLTEARGAQPSDGTGQDVRPLWACPVADPYGARDAGGAAARESGSAARGWWSLVAPRRTRRRRSGRAGTPGTYDAAVTRPDGAGAADAYLEGTGAADVPPEGAESTAGADAPPATAMTAATVTLPGDTPATASDTASPISPVALRAVSRPRVQVRLLGAVMIEGPGGRVDCSNGKDLPDLLGLLAVHRDGLTREKAHELLWPDVDLSDYDRFHSRKKEIRRRLRRALGDPVRETMLIKQVSHRYLLNPDLVAVDYWQLTDALTAAAAATGLRERLTELRRATDLYTGPFLPGGTRPWSVPIAEDLRRNVVRALTTLIEHEHEAARLIPLLERALELDPCNEPLRRRHMRLHADLGRIDEAHRSYQALLAALEDLGGLRPSPVTMALYLRLSGRSAE